MNIKKILKNEYGLEPESVEKINDGVINDNFHVKTKDNEYLFKIYKTDSGEKVNFEIDLYKELETNNFPAPRIVKRVNSFLYGRSENFYVLFEYIAGRMLEDIDEQKVKSVGGLLGKMHNIFSEYKQDIDVVIWEPKDIEKMVFDDFKIVEKRDFKDAKIFVEYIKNEYGKLNFLENLPKGITHQDVKSENIIEGEDGKISLIDFNNCYHGVLLYDVMTFVIWVLCDSDGRLNVSLFKEYLMAYSKERKLIKVEIDNIFEALKFRLLREAYVWPYRWLDKEKARKYSRMFIDCYKDVIKNEEDYKIELEKIW